jgi:threonine/homoserine/homoserine lactone efflux protein
MSGDSIGPVWPHHLLAFALTVTIMVVSPGAGFAFVLSTATRLGRIAGATGVIGMLTGYLTHAGLSLAHLQGRVTLGPKDGLWLRWFGGALLVYLALRALRRAFRAPAPATPGAQSRLEHGSDALRRSSKLTGMEQPLVRLFLSGLLVTTLNPSVLALYIGIAPQHLPVGRPTIAMLVLALVNVTVAAAWYGTLLWSLGRYHRFLERPVTRRGIDVVTGVMLMWFAWQATQ